MTRYLNSTTENNQVYLNEIDIVLPRLLSLIDTDPLSPSKGVADRQWWAWKLIDFPNATFQGMAHGLALLYAQDQLASQPFARTIPGRIDELFEGTRHITRPGGHLEEALPNERSFCVTALCAFDLLHAAEALGSRAPSTSDVIIGPLIHALLKNDETHGLISNHLATAAAALLRWHHVSGENEARKRGQMFLDRILKNQSDEGWFVEYAGADPGYQTLCVSHLADIWRLTRDERLHQALALSCRFLAHFAHPDGSFGGLYGARATRVYYPAGHELLTGTIPEAAALARFMRNSIAAHTTVPLSAIDPPNLVPLFNNYVTAALAENNSGSLSLPCERLETVRIHLPKSGFIVDSGPSHYSIVSTHKGGVVYHWQAQGGMRIDPGAAFADGQDRIYTNQQHNTGNGVVLDGDGLIIKAALTRYVHHRPNLWNFLVLRFLCATLMRIPVMASWIKRLLASILISNHGASAGNLRRHIRLGRDLRIEDMAENCQGLRRLDVDGPFSTLHMASQGYWQRQDDAA